MELLCVEVDVERPTVYVAQMKAPNALALGSASGGGFVLDYGLFRLLSADELQAVIAHELAAERTGRAASPSLPRLRGYRGRNHYITIH